MKGKKLLHSQLLAHGDLVASTISKNSGFMTLPHFRTRLEDQIKPDTDKIARAAC